MHTMLMVYKCVCVTMGKTEVNSLFSKMVIIPFSSFFIDITNYYYHIIQLCTYINTYLPTYIHIYIYIHTYIHIYIYIYTYIHGNPQKDRKVFPMISTSCFQISHVSIALETPGGAPDGSLNFSFTETAKAVFDQGEWRDGDVYICMYVM